MGVEFVELRKNRGRSVIDYVTGLMGMECLSSCIAYLGERHIHMPPPPNSVARKQKWKIYKTCYSHINKYAARPAQPGFTKMVQGYQQTNLTKHEAATFALTAPSLSIIMQGFVS